MATSIDLNSLSHFKEEIVNSLCQVEEKAEFKISQFDSYLNNQLESFQMKISELYLIINSLTEKTTKLEMKVDTINNTMPNIKKVSETVTTSEIKLENIEKDIEKMKIKYEKNLDNLQVKGVIGEFCKYKNFKEFVNSTCNDLGLLKNFKDKTLYDIKGCNDKIIALNTKMEACKKANGNCINERLRLVEKDYEEKINQYMDQIMEVKVENSKYFQDMILNVKKTNQQIEQLDNVKKQLKKEYEEYVLNIEKRNQLINNNFNNMKDNFNQISHKFKTLYEFIKDIRFKKNLKDVSKKDIKNMIMNTDVELNGKDISEELINHEKNEEGNIQLKEANNFLSSVSNSMFVNNNNPLSLSQCTINNTEPIDIQLPSIENKQLIHSQSLCHLNNDKPIHSPSRKYSLDSKKINGKSMFKISIKKKKKVKSNFNQN